MSNAESTPNPPRKRLLKLLRSGRLKDWEFAERLVCEYEAEQRTLWLPELFEDPDHDVRDLAIGLAVERIQDDYALLDSLLHVIESTTYSGAAQAVVLVLRTFTQRHDPEAAAFSDDIDRLLTQLSQESDGDVRYQAFAARELREHSGAEYEALLLSLLMSSDEDFKIVAAQGIARLRPEGGGVALEEAYHGTRGEAQFQLLLAMAACEVEGLVPEFEAALRSGARRFAAIQAMGDYGDVDGSQALLKITRGWFGDPLEKVAAAHALARLGRDSGLELLKKFARDRRPEVKGYALEAMVALDLPEMETRLLRVLDEAPDAATETATALLKNYPSEATDAALKLAAVNHPREGVRETASEVLAEWYR